MKKFYSLFMVGLVCFAVNAQVADTFYVDFGKNDGTNGHTTASPDKNGNYWNNLVDFVTDDEVDLVNNKNGSGPVYIKVTDGAGANGILNGGLLEPEDAKLGDFAIATATEDYFFTTPDNPGAIEIGGLNPAKGYVLSFFGTRAAESIRETRYVITGAVETKDSLQTSGTDLGGTGYHGNNSTIVETDTLYPDSEGKMTIEIEIISGGFAYLGCMKIAEVYTGASGLNNNKIDPSACTIYPNPSNGVVNIKTNQKIEKVEIIGINGKLVYNSLMEDGFEQVNLSNGIYFVKLKGADFEMAQKLVVR